jgi:phytoene dehydrogenase-like protein
MNHHAYDAIIIGGGHNGLVSAATLAKAGFRVLVLEQRDVLGGAAATEEPFSGYHFNTGADDAALFLDDIARDLFLKMHGLQFRESPVAVFAPQADGSALTLWRDAARTAQELQSLNGADAARYTAFASQIEQMGSILNDMFLRTPPDLGRWQVGDLLSWGTVGLRMKRLGNKEMMAFMRLLPMPAFEYLNEWFNNEALKGALAGPAVTGMGQGPRAAGTTLMLLYQHSNGFQRTRFVVGGIGALSRALANAARSNGAEVRTGAPVTRIMLKDGRASGVQLDSGEQLTARAILSSVDPRRTFFDLVGPSNLEPRFVRHVRNIIYRGSTAKVNLALSGLPEFHGQQNLEQLGGHIVFSPSLDYLERAYDDAKYGRISRQPFLDVVIPTLTDPALAPQGHHTMSIRMQYAPYALRESDWEAQREPLGDLIIDTLSLVAPDLKQHILHRQALTPLDWEREYGLSEGSIFHGQMGLDQLLVMRPVPAWSQYRTPLPNLYLCGAGAHPGGGVTGAPGYNAAREVARVLSATTSRA